MVQTAFHNRSDLGWRVLGWQAAPILARVGWQLWHANPGWGDWES